MVSRLVSPTLTAHYPAIYASYSNLVYSKAMKLPGAPAIGGAIRHLREEKGLSQLELARRSRVTQATVSRIESGTRRGDLETLALIAAGLGLALWVLVKRAEGIGVARHQLLTMALSAFAIASNANRQKGGE